MSNDTKIFIKKQSLLSFRKFDDLTYVELSGSGDGVPYQEDTTLVIDDAASTVVRISGSLFSDLTSAWILPLIPTVTYRVRLRVDNNSVSSPPPGLRFRLGYGPYTDYFYTSGIIETDIVCGLNLGDEFPGLLITFENGWAGTLHWVEVFDVPYSPGTEECVDFTNYSFRNGSQLGMSPTGQTNTLVIDANLTLNGGYLGVDVYNVDSTGPTQGESYRIDMVFTPDVGQPALTRDIQLYLGYGSATGSPYIIPAGTTTYSQTLQWVGGSLGTGSVGTPFFMRPVTGQTAVWLGTITMTISSCTTYSAGSAYYELETSGDVPIPLTYSIGDIREPEKRASSFSKTIVLPGTKNNSKVFCKLFEIEGEGTYDPRRKVDCFIVQSGSIVFEGTLQVLKVNRSQDNTRDYNFVSYEVAVLSSFADLFSTIGEKLLTDLDLSRYDHVFDLDNVIHTGYVHDDIPANEYVMVDGSPVLNWDLGASFVSDRVRFQDIDSTGNRVSIKTDSAHGLAVGDQIFVMSTTQIKKSRIGGYQVVYGIVSSTEFVITMGWSDIVDTLLVATNDGTYFTIEEFQGIKMTPTGEGYCYPQIDNGVGDSSGADGANSVYRPQLLRNMAPATYVKTLVDQIFKESQYSYSSTFLDSPFFKRLIVPGMVSTFTKSDDLQFDMSCRVELTGLSAFSHPTCTANTWSEDGGTATFGIGELLPFNDNSSGTNFDNGDPSDNWNTSTYRYTLSVASGLNVRVKGSVYHCAQSGNPNPSSVATQLVFTVYDASNVVQWSKQVNVLPFGGLGSYTAVGAAANAVPFDVTVASNGWPNDNVVMQAGWYVTVRLRAQGSTNGGANLLYGVTEDTKVECWPDAALWPGNTISITSALPLKVKQREFLLDLVKMFNLYLQPRRDDPRIIDIEPRDDFYNLDEQVDWTPLADLSKQVTISPLGDLAAKTFVYTYKEDKDALNKLYTEGFKEVYGQTTKVVFNDFVKDEKKIELTASATPIAGPNLYYTADPEINLWDRYLSCVVQNQPTAAGVPGGSLAPNYRILYWAPRTGYYQQGWWINNQDDTSDLDSFVYGYAGHLDHVYAPTYDLNFGYPREVYFDQISWTDNNLFNRFHREEILDRSSPTSKVISVYFNLRPTDIAQLDFRKGYVFDGHLCRLNKVNDYNASAFGETTLVELVTIESARTNFVPTTVVRSGVGFGTGPVGVDENDGLTYERTFRPTTSGDEAGLLGGINNLIRNSTGSVIVGGSNNSLNGAIGGVLIGVEDFERQINNSVLIGDATDEELTNVVHLKKDRIVTDGSLRVGKRGTPHTQVMSGKVRVTKDTNTTLDTSSPGTPLILAGEGFTASATLYSTHTVKLKIEFDDVLEGAASDGSNVVTVATINAQTSVPDDVTELDTNSGLPARLTVGVLQSTDSDVVIGISYNNQDNGWNGDVEVNFITYVV